MSIQRRSEPSKTLSKTFKRIATIVYGIVAAVTITLGIVYLSRNTFMPYHAEALGAPWHTLAPPVRVLILVLIRLVGAGWVFAGCVMVGFTVHAWRSPNRRWPWILLPLTVFTVHSATLYATLHVKFATGAHSPWGPTVLLLALAVLAMGLQRIATRRACIALLIFLGTIPSRAYAKNTVDATQTQTKEPIEVVPFSWHALAGGNYRPNSPITETSLLLQPAVPLPSIAGSDYAVLLAVYRYDVLVPHATVTQRRLHRFEIGLPLSWRLKPRWSLDLDLRAVYAAPLDQYHANAWYPNARIGLGWGVTRDLAVSGTVVFTRGALGLVPLPALGILWTPTHQWRVEGLAPRYIEVARKLGSSAEVFLAGHWQSHVWALESSEEDLLRITRQEVRLHLGARARVYGPLGIAVALRWSPLQRLDVAQESRAAFAPQDVSMTVSFVVDRSRSSTRQ